MLLHGCIASQVKGGATDAALLAEGRVEYMGQPIGLIVARAPRLAEEAAGRVAVRYGHPKVRRNRRYPVQDMASVRCSYPRRHP